MVLESQEISVAAVLECSDVAVDFVMNVLDSVECSLLTKTQIIIAVEELFGNIARYAYAEKPGMITLRCILELKKQLIIIQLSDMGKPFNPLEVPEPDIKSGIREREVGGLGIFIVKKSVDKFLYNYKKGKNIVTIIKKIA
ncbi:MAG: ATP-binding protein [Anaerocolumna sp.]